MPIGSNVWFDVFTVSLSCAKQLGDHARDDLSGISIPNMGFVVVPIRAHRGRDEARRMLGEPLFTIYATT
jgi:hypothetical protein